MNPPTFSCDELPAQSLTVAQAQQQILAHIAPMVRTEIVTLVDALGRVSADSVNAPFSVPPHRNSAMDGYAVASNTLVSGMNRLQVIGTSLAGHPFLGRVNSGQCVRIMTGAVVPTGADAVIAQEEVKREPTEIVYLGEVKQGRYVRLAGDDFAQGDPVIAKGRVINAADIGVLASLGIHQLSVWSKPRIAILSTGDELQAAGQPLRLGQIYDSNRYTLGALLQRLGVECLDLGIVRDTPAALEHAFSAAMQQADMLITSGGVSVGDADFVTSTLARLGQVNFWKIAMKPGKPLAFGALESCLFFGLPGNPVSVMATFLVLVRPAILKLANYPPTALAYQIARCSEPLTKAVGRQDYQRGIASQDEQGQWWVRSTGLQESHVLRSMSVANCFIVLPQDWGNVGAGTEVNIILFEQLL